MLDGQIKHTGSYQQLVAQGVDLAAFVPLKEQQQAEADEQQQQQQIGQQLPQQLGQQQQQQQAIVQFTLESPVLTPVTSPRAANNTAAAEGESVTSLQSNNVVTSPSKVTSRSLVETRGKDRSFSGTVIELPSYLTPTAPALTTANSFASHRPVKVDQEFLGTAGAADSADQQPQDFPARPAASSSSSLQKPALLETIEDLLVETDAAAASEPAAAAVGRVADSPDGSAVVILGRDDSSVTHHHDHHQMSDEEEDHHHETVGLMSHPDWLLRSDDITAGISKDKVTKSERGVKDSERSAVKSDQSDIDQKGKLVKAEERAKGQVKRSVYLAYLSAWGPLFLLPIAVTLGEFVALGFLRLCCMLCVATLRLQASLIDQPLQAAAQQQLRSHPHRLLQLLTSDIHSLLLFCRCPC